MTTLLVSLLCFFSSAVLFADPPPAPPSVAEQIKTAFRQALEEAKPVSASEKIFFETEVLDNTQSFIQDFKQDRDSINVKIDTEKLKNYIHFLPPQGSQRFNNKVCLTLRTDPECSSCSALIDPLKKYFAERLSKRGYQVSDGPSFPEESKLFGEGAFEDISTRSVELQCDATAYLELLALNTNVDPHDAEFSSLISVRAQGYMRALSWSGKKIRAENQSLVRMPKNLDPAKNGSQISTLAKNIIDKQSAELFSQLGAQVSTGLAANESKEERYLRLDAVQSYYSYSKFKLAMATNLPEVKMEERFMSPGSVSFSVETRLSLEDLAEKLKRISLGDAKLEVVGKSDQELAVVMK